MLTVGVIRGGNSRSYDESLKTGENILAALREKLRDRYLSADIFIDKENNIFMNGLPTTWDDIGSNIQLVFNALHGDELEQEEIQNILEKHGIAYVGTKISSIPETMSRIRVKEILDELKIQTPTHIMIPQYAEVFDAPADSWALAKAREVHNKMPPPWNLRPVRSLRESYIVKTLPELVSAFLNLADGEDDILVEEVIWGDHASVGVLENFRNQEHYTYFPVKIGMSKLMDPNFQQNGTFRYFHENESRQLQEYAGQIHRAFALSHFSNSNFIVHPTKGIYYIDTHIDPPLYEGSPMHHMIHSVGSNTAEFVDHIIKLALLGK